MNTNARLFVAGLMPIHWYQQQIDAISDGFYGEPLTIEDTIKIDALCVLQDKAEAIVYGGFANVEFIDWN